MRREYNGTDKFINRFGVYAVCSNNNNQVKMFA